MNDITDDQLLIFTRLLSEWNIHFFSKEYVTKVFSNLPDNIQEMGVKYGMDDPVFKDKAYVYLLKFKNIGYDIHK